MDSMSSSTRNYSSNLQQVASTLPITSLCFLPSTHILESILLSGEGPVCKLYSPSTTQLLHTRRIFSREAVRGIAFEESLFSSSSTIPENDVDEVEEIEGGNRQIVFWGGHRIVVTTLQELIADSPNTSATASLANLPPTVTPSSTSASYTDEQGFRETPVKDYVHHAFFISRPGLSLVGVVTSHNLLLLYDPDARKWVGEKDMGERCILYSATGVYVPDESGDSGRVIVAAGTVFGEILVWSAPIDPPPPPAIAADPAPGLHNKSQSIDSEAWTELASDSEGEGWEELTKSTVLDSRAGTPKGHRRKTKRGVELHYRLKGHEGSIFGVDISPQYSLGIGGRYLVSCSDDRTVRVWDISRVDQTEDDEDVGKLRESLAWDELEADELRGTGFTPTEGSKGPEGPKNDCIAIGWGHQARIWNCRFLHQLCDDCSHTKTTINIVTTSEDLTSKVWGYSSFGTDTTTSVKSKNTQPITPLVCLTTTLLHSGKNVFALAVSETHKLLATGGLDGRVAVINYDTASRNSDEVESYEWEVGTAGGKDVEMELEAVERTFSGLNIQAAKISPDDVEATGSKSKASTDQFRSYAIVDRNRYVVCTSKGYLALYTFPSKTPGRRVPSALGGWRNLGQWDTLAGFSSVAAWEGSGLVAAQGKSGIVGIIDLDDFGDGRNEKGYTGSKGRWWKAGEGNAGGLFCGRHGDLFYLLTTSLLTPEIRLHLFPDPRASAPTIRNSPYPPPHIKTIILCPPPTFHSVTSYHLDFSQGLLFVGSRTGVLCVFDVWSGVEADIMLNPLESWRGWCDKDAITGILPYPTHAGSTKPQQPITDPRLAGAALTPLPPTAGLSRSSRIITTGRNGVYAILDVSLSSNSDPTTNSSRITLTKLHIKKLLNGGSIEGAYHRIPIGSNNSNSPGDLLLYGFRGISFFVWNETRGYEVLSEECGGGHRSWVFYPIREGEGVGWFVWTQAGKMFVRRAKKVGRKLLQVGGHGREIKAMAVSPLPVGGGNRLIATGAEDTLIRLSTLRPEKTEKGKVRMGLKGVAVFKRHTTGIQHLEWSSCGDYLFSSGGVEEFYVWRIRRLESPGGPGSGSSGKGRDAVGVVCEAVCPVQSVVPDLRIMGFDVSTVGVPWSEEGRGKAFLISMVYSDSSLKVWMYDPNLKNFRILIQGRYKTNCLLHVKHFIHRKEVAPDSGLSTDYTHSSTSLQHHYQHHTTSTQSENTFLLFIAGTDGHVTVYDITKSLRRAGISITPLGVNLTAGSRVNPIINDDGATTTNSNSNTSQSLPPLIARSDLLTSPPPPTQLLPSPPTENWTRQIHQSSIKSMVILPLDIGTLSNNTSNRHGVHDQFGYHNHDSLSPASLGRIAVVILTGGDDTAFSSTVFTLTAPSTTPFTTTTSLSDNEPISISTPSWSTKTIPEAHASAITAVVPVRKGKMKWSGDVDSEPIKEITLGCLTVGVDRVLKGWEVALLMLGGGGATGKSIDVKVTVNEAKGGARGYSPVADVSGAAIMGDIDGDTANATGYSSAKVVVVGVGIDVWDVVL